MLKSFLQKRKKSFRIHRALLFFVKEIFKERIQNRKLAAVKIEIGFFESEKIFRKLTKKKCLKKFSIFFHFYCMIFRFSFHFFL